MRDPLPLPPPPEASELAEAAGRQAEDLLVTKRQWGAFVGTNLDQALRRHGITNIVFGGIASNLGVERAARAAVDLGYAVIFAEDAMTSIRPEAHSFAVNQLFPLMGRVSRSDEVSTSLAHWAPDRQASRRI